VYLHSYWNQADLAEHLISNGSSIHHMDTTLQWCFSICFWVSR